MEMRQLLTVGAFAGLAIGLLVLKMTRQQAHTTARDLDTSAHQPNDSASPEPLLLMADH
jgi:hypothetical protein